MSTPQFRTFIRGLWQREAALSLEQQARAPQPISLFQGEQSEVVLDVYDELGQPLDMRGVGWSSNLSVVRQFNGAPPILTLVATPTPTPNRVIFTLAAGALNAAPFGRYIYSVVTAQTENIIRVTVPPSLFHISPMII